MNKTFFECTGLGVCAVENGDVFVEIILGEDFLCNIVAFIDFGLGLIENNFIAAELVGVEIEYLVTGVFANDMIGGI